VCIEENRSYISGKEILILGPPTPSGGPIFLSGEEFAPNRAPVASMKQETLESGLWAPGAATAAGHGWYNHYEGKCPPPGRSEGEAPIA
jgi:hypothetical protein